MSNPNGPFSYDNATFESVFWGRFQRVDSGCLEWSGYRTPSGYGQLTRKGRRALTHRIAYEMSVGPIPAGMHVMHKCDNRSCGEREHLSLGSADDNLADMRSKGRHSKGAEHSRLTSEGKRRASNG